MTHDEGAIVHLPRAAKEAARELLPADRPAGRLARAWARRLGLSKPRHSVRIIDRFARAEPAATFVQVGANDGTALDPLHDAIARSRWTGVMVEPVPYVFERLQKTMAGNSRVALANVAIAEREGTQDFFHLAEATEDDPIWAWYHALGSFNREVLLSHAHLIPDIESRLVTTPVPCITFDALCERHGLSTVDVVQIDTEGYDHVVLGMIDLERYRPKVVMYEHVHVDERAQRDLLERLRDHGYSDFSDDMDTVAVHRDCLAQHPALARTMREARRTLESQGLTA